MKLNVAVNGQPGHLELEQRGETWWFRHESADAPTREGTASVVEVEPGVYSVLWDGRSFEAKLVWNASQGSGSVDIAGAHFAVQAADPREIAEGAGGIDNRGPLQITSPMPGKVIRVLVEQGQSVTEKQGIAVVEAMKMQNEMQAPRAGTVAAIRVQAGDAVTAGQVLAVIE